MKIGIIGSGNVGGALGTGWAKAGHEVIFGSRKPDSEEMQALARAAGARAASPQEAAAAAEVVLLATPWPATRGAVEGLGDLEGKILIDATNPLKPDLSALEYGTSTSGGEMVAGWARNARVVKAFNSVGANVMAEATFGSGRPAMFYCGDDAAAKQTARGLIEQLSFDAVDVGPLTAARALEPLALLWLALAYKQGMGREIAFALLRR